jgi:hypothetical protein
MEELHIARLDLDGKRHWFASPDGERWLEVTRPPEDNEWDEFDDLFHGRGKKINPLKIGRPWLESMGATFL